VKKRSIVFKLFIVTTLIFSVFLCIFMAGQTLFFKGFYLSMKTSRLENSLDKFSHMYETENWDSTNITRNINKFADQNNAQIALLDENGNTKYTPTFEFVLETSDNKNKIKIPLSNIAYLEGFQNLKLAIGSEIEVGGYFTDDFSQVKLLSSIKNGTSQWENSNTPLFTAAGNSKNITQANPEAITTIISEINNGNNDNTAIAVAPTQTLQANGITIPGINIEKDNNLSTAAAVPVQPLQGGSVSLSKIYYKKIDGKIVDLDIPSEIAQMANYSKDLLWSSIDYWNGLLVLKKIKIEPEKIINFHYTNPSNGMDNIVLAKPIYKDNKLSEFIFVVSTLQPVGEAVDVLKGYYLYAFLAALILIAGMALLFSRIIAKPLIKMNQIAFKMADLDFSEEVTVTSNDELGSMAVSLNRLSKNLRTSLTELKNANEQLQLDIEKEKDREIIRKEFVASVSHELKTPLGIIKGFAEGVKDNIAENKKEHYINVILDEIEKMDELVLDLLDLAKLESNAYKPDMEDFNITDLLNDVETRLINRIYEKKIRLKHEYEGKNFKVCGDLRRIEQVVMNIMNNAIKHTNHEGDIKIGIKEQKNVVYISIENSGSHIREEDLKRIWERFYRAEKSRDRKTGGTGLGLSIVKNILEIHVSRFGAENTEDGVSFYFTLEKALDVYYCANIDWI